MNCRAFHNNLEEYLQDGLDFTNRFAIERHTQECIGCRKDLADAIELRRMALDLKRVKAPADFESSLLDKIGMYKAHRRFSALRRFWIFGPEWLSWKKLVVASSSLAVLALGIIVASHWKAINPASPLPVDVNQLDIKIDWKALNPAPPPPLDVNVPDKVSEKEKRLVNTKAASFELSRAAMSDLKSLQIPIVQNRTNALSVSTPLSDGFEIVDSPTEVTKFVITGMDVRPEPVRMLPPNIRIQYIPASEEYFIYNVSH
jgi:hypothetical protein